MRNQEIEINVSRHDATKDKSLRAYSAADELLLKEFDKLFQEPIRLAIYHDRFGFLSCYLHEFNPITVLTNKSQQKSINLNLEINNLPSVQFENPLASFNEKLDCALIKMPKSLALFEMFLAQIAQNSTDDVVVVVAFMTRHFSSKIVEISKTYFESVEQSRAVKKARLVTLRQKKVLPKLDIIDVLVYNNQEYKQYHGVFSAKHIDYATQFFLQYIDIKESDNCILDLASGNGVIANEILIKRPNAEIHLMDDFFLAVESAKLNVTGQNIHHHFDNNLETFVDNYFDLIVTNPPFHFEYETNINISIDLFKECYRCLKCGGNLQVVANKHLNYRTHLDLIFSSVEVLGENEKFIIYKCLKS